MDAIQIIALCVGVAWASGINLYAAIFIQSLLGSTGHIHFPPDLHVVTDPLIMFAVGLIYCIEFFACKVPGVDTPWDTKYTFIFACIRDLIREKYFHHISPRAGSVTVQTSRHQDA